MKKTVKRILVIVLVLALVLLLIPSKSLYDDGGTVKYSAVLWQVEVFHQILDDENGQRSFLVGPRVTLFRGRIPIYDGTHIVTEP